MAQVSKPRPYRAGDKVGVRHLPGEWQLVGRGEEPRTWFVFPFNSVALALSERQVRDADDRYQPWVTQEERKLYSVTVPSSGLVRLW